MNNEKSFLKVTGQMINLVVVVFGIAAAYFLTLQSLKVELAAKAESGVVEALDKKLGNFEVILKEGVVSREQFYQFSKDIENRLTRIEEYLVKQTGDNLEKR